MLFENQKALNPEDLVKYAEGLGLDMPKFKECLDGGKHAEEINKDMAEGQKAGVSGTPSSLIGWVQDDGKTVKALKIVKGAQPYAAFKDAIESLLAPKKKHRACLFDKAKPFEKRGRKACEPRIYSGLAMTMEQH